MRTAVYNCWVKRGSDEDLLHLVSGLPITNWTGVSAKIQLRDKGAGETGAVRSTFTIGTGIYVSVVGGSGTLRATFSSNPAAPNTSMLELGKYDYDLLIKDASGAKLYYLQGVCEIEKRTTVDEES